MARSPQNTRAVQDTSVPLAPEDSFDFSSEDTDHTLAYELENVQVVSYSVHASENSGDAHLDYLKVTMTNVVGPPSAFGDDFII